MRSQLIGRTLTKAVAVLAVLAAAAAPAPAAGSRLGYTTHALFSRLPSRSNTHEGAGKAPGNRRGWADVKYYVYDPSKILMYSRCSNSSSSSNSEGGGLVNTAKHSMDWLFVRLLLEEGRSVPPEDAEIFVVPALMSQSQSYPGIPSMCGNHEENLRDLIETLESSPWFRRQGGVDHLVVADSYTAKTAALSLPGQVMIARYECPSNWYTAQLTPGNFQSRHPCVAIGDSTYRALSERGALWPPVVFEPMPPSQRRYDVSFIGLLDQRPAYLTRREALCSWIAAGRPHQDRFFFHASLHRKTRLPNLCTKGIGLAGGYSGATAAKDWSLKYREFIHSPASSQRVGCSESMRVMADSRFFLQLKGDTITTDRLYNMFDTRTVPVVPESELPRLLKALPFRDVVPWEKLFVKVPQKEWNRNPIQSVIDTVDSVTPSEYEAKYRLLELHAADVSYTSKDTRAHTNTLAAAYETMTDRQATVRLHCEECRPQSTW